MNYDEMFRSLKGCAFVPFTVAGDPDPETSIEIIRTMVDAGADALEIGFPFSDPIADGTSVQEADIRALKAGMTTEKCFRIIEKVREFTSVPVGLLVYYNLIYHMGVDEFYRRAAEAGVTGILAADLPPEEASDAIRAAEKYGLDQIFIVAPTTDNERLRRISENSSGFHYLVSVMGVTGARSRVEESTINLIERVRRESRLPVMVGFGVSRPEHVKKIKEAGADGVIVGSAIIDIISENLDDRDRMLQRIHEMVKLMKKATED
ncbi:tryptophan synthase subunit alpha [Methanothermobacter wolfeii]|uniref:Tryptophan synthase alpha chain n=1 Tax=Methanothermobacter wolfeii TaxID=145261 RepID=A0A9E7ULY9_METWO|nr:MULTISPECIES: tryptophan synthase subunit alpha [Methanothermobacter]MDI6702872.1 tryptophan synthase subunit alpha [Methanothermobacter wolfeii]MDI6841401.1 tryptophan synthase subunit alpha [Methanothermobacter wolfeii]NLM02692.1 tryptophan synthase subunit alpha [Methanothermobacter wolfeii]QHN05777.1 tryptophan synthase subunit alpha [Methanothermobacter sp. THM-1]UXH31925.1 tryptophan synthase subunit alpha [Methanothermobacter wolfeii]